MAKAWGYDEYWAMVLGENRSAIDVVNEFELVEKGLDEWLGLAEAEAWAMWQSGDMPVEWVGFHVSALGDLREAARVART